MNGTKHLSKLALSVCAALPLVAAASQTTPVRGLHDNSSTYIALQNATIVTEPGKKLENATLVINNGKVVAVARNNRAPEGARVIDASGHTIYPALLTPTVTTGFRLLKSQIVLRTAVLRRNTITSAKVVMQQMMQFTHKWIG